MTVHQAMAAVMADIESVGKHDRNTQQGFNFRGIDAVVNAVGPALREHGVLMIPTAGEPTVDQYQSRGGAQMTHVLLPVTFTFYGPDGDSLTCTVIGEASDAGDKVMSKAHSVAWRVALLECFAIPTDEPDPDSESHERAVESLNEPDWPAMGWHQRAEHDTARNELGKRSKRLHSDDQKALKAWLGSQGWVLPYTRDEMDAWAAEIDRLEVEAETPADEPVPA